MLIPFHTKRCDTHQMVIRLPVSICKIISFFREDDLLTCKKINKKQNKTSTTQEYRAK